MSPSLLPHRCARAAAAIASLGIVLALCACAGLSPPTTRARGCPAEACVDEAKHAGPSQTLDALRPARQAARRARALPPGPAAQREWLRCALAAGAWMGGTDPALAMAAASQANECTEAFLRGGLALSPQPWSSGVVRLGGVPLALDAQRPSAELRGPMTVRIAADVPLLLLDERHVRPGFGVPVALLSPRCQDTPRCQLLPPEGVFRAATAWLEPAPAGGAVEATLRLADPQRQPRLQVGAQAFTLAADGSTFFEYGAQQSALQRLGVWGLFGGDEVGRRAGVYLLEDYDPDKRPVVMVHGLGSSPLAWARLSNALWNDPALRARYQVWHVVYQTNAPLLVSRQRVQQYLDDAWRLLDPQRRDPARDHVVLVGHSLGGVVSRLLCADSGRVLWDAAFTVPPGVLQGAATDRRHIDGVFLFAPYPGVKRAIFLAAPHQGSPATDRWFGRLAHRLVGRRAPEIQALRTLARDHPEMVQPALREAYRQGWLNSITTLGRDQPVSRAGRALLPAAGIAYHTIAGALPASAPPGDGVVPLDSALLPGAASTLVLPSDHALYDAPEAIDEVIRILHEDLRADEAVAGRGQPTRAE